MKKSFKVKIHKLSILKKIKNLQVIALNTDGTPMIYLDPKGKSPKFLENGAIIVTPPMIPKQ